MNTKRFIKLLAVLIVAIMCTSAFTACSLGNASKYRQALELTEQGDYEAAYALFTELGDYKDAKKEAAKFRYVPIKETAEFISPDGTKIENLVISLNENNLPFQNIKTGENGYQHTCLISYTADNQLMKVSCSATDGTTEYYECTYDQNGNLIKEYTVYQDGSTSTSEYTYNENGDRTKLEITESTGYFYSAEYTFDADGRESKVILTDEYGIYIYNNVYDEEGNLIQEIVTDENSNETTIYEHSYDEQCNLLETTINEGDSVWVSRKCTYDENGQTIREHHNFSDGYFVTWEYAYDANGNVINKHININGSSNETYTTEYKLVYIPFEYTAEEWDRIVFGLIGW